MLAGLLGKSLPTAIIGGGIASLGYVGSQVVKTGQEQTRMELALKMSSKDMNEYRDWETDRKSTRLNSSHSAKSRMPSSA